MNAGIVYSIYRFLYIKIPTFFSCIRVGLPYNSTWDIDGTPVIIRRKWYEKVFAKHIGGNLSIGDNFCCHNKIDKNSIGLIQPCVFNIAIDNSTIKIGKNVGISGATINAASTIIIEDNVIIGSGCIITDTDSHPIDYNSRIVTNNNANTTTSPVTIKEGAFIGARSIILKGVTIGRHSVVGAGSVVSKSVPDNCIVCGNPAIIVKRIQS